MYVYTYIYTYIHVYVYVYIYIWPSSPAAGPPRKDYW